MNHSSRHAQGAASVQDSASSSFASAEFPWLTFPCRIGIPTNRARRRVGFAPSSYSCRRANCGQVLRLPFGASAIPPPLPAHLVSCGSRSRTGGRRGRPLRLGDASTTVSSSRRADGRGVRPLLRCGRVRPLSRVAGAFPRAEGEVRRGWRSPRSVGPVCRRRRSPSVSGRPEAGSRPFTRWRRLVCLAAFQRESRLQGGEKKSHERSAAAQLLPPCLGSEPGTRGVRRFDFKPAAILEFLETWTRERPPKGGRNNR